MRRLAALVASINHRPTHSQSTVERRRRMRVTVVLFMPLLALNRWDNPPGFLPDRPIRHVPRIGSPAPG